MLIKLWTVRPESDFSLLQQQGFYTADNVYVMPERRAAYQWMARQLAAKTPAEQQTFRRIYRSEMAAPENARTIQLLAALSKQTNFSVGCYCEDESRCHRRLLRELLEEAGAEMV